MIFFRKFNLCDVVLVAINLAEVKFANKVLGNYFALLYLVS